MKRRTSPQADEDAGHLRGPGHQRSASATSPRSTRRPTSPKAAGADLCRRSFQRLAALWATSPCNAGEVSGRSRRRSPLNPHHAPATTAGVFASQREYPSSRTCKTVQPHHSGNSFYFQRVIAIPIEFSRRLLRPGMPETTRPGMTTSDLTPYLLRCSPAIRPCSDRLSEIG